MAEELSITFVRHGRFAADPYIATNEQSDPTAWTKAREKGRELKKLVGGGQNPVLCKPARKNA